MRKVKQLDITVTNYFPSKPRIYDADGCPLFIGDLVVILTENLVSPLREGDYGRVKGFEYITSIQAHQVLVYTDLQNAVEGGPVFNYWPNELYLIIREGSEG